MMRSPLRRPSAAQLVSGATVLALVAALTVVSTAGSGRQTVLASAQRPATTTSATTSTRVCVARHRARQDPASGLASVRSR
jgi:hypothetical protein